MSRRLDAMRCKEDQFIRALYAATKGNTNTCGDVRTIARKLRYDRGTCTSIISYFVERGIIEQRNDTLHHLVNLTVTGADFVEVTFADSVHLLQDMFTECTEGAACVYDRLASRVRKVRSETPVRSSRDKR